MIFLGIFFFVYVYLATDYLGALGLHGFSELLAILLLMVPFGCIIWLFRIFWNRNENPDSETIPDKILVWAAYLSMGLISFVFVLSLMRDFVSLVLLIVLRTPPPLHGPASFWLITFASLVCAALGFKNARYVLEVTPVTVALKDLPSELNGFRIAQISDLHIGSTIHDDQIARVIDKVNKLNCDIVVLTGDIIDGYASELTRQISGLAQLKARLGCFYVTGNHEYYWGAPAIIAEIRKTGIHVLLNESMIVEKQGKQVLVAGVPDYTAGRMSQPKPDVGLAMSNIITAPGYEKAPLLDPGAIKILLAHQPSMADDAAAAGYDLQFSGHTHGGQFFPWTYAVRFAHKYPRGLYHVGQMWLYVNRGTGYWGPPLRLGSPAEVTFMTLRQRH